MSFLVKGLAIPLAISEFLLRLTAIISKTVEILEKFNLDLLLLNEKFKYIRPFCRFRPFGLESDLPTATLYIITAMGTIVYSVSKTAKQINYVVYTKRKFLF